MSTDKMIYDANIYTDLQGLQSIRQQINKNPKVAQKEVSQQFESLLVQMLLKSMRDTNKAFTSDLMGSEQANLYEDLFDKQLSLLVSKSGIGFAKTIEDFLNKTQSTQKPPEIEKVAPSPISSTAEKNTQAQASMKQALNPAQTVPVADKAAIPSSIESASNDSKTSASYFDSAMDFIQTLWAPAKAAAAILGADPKILLAQAALETNWGKNIISQTQGGTTHNLFNIKADSRWHNESTQVNTLEFDNDVLVKEKAKFRAYNSYSECFQDYVHFLKNNSRYNEALKNAADPQKFVNSLQEASYATDKNYSEKIMQIYSNEKFNNLFKTAKLI